MRDYHRDPEHFKRFHHQRKKGDKLFFGIFVLALGLLWLLSEMDLHVFTWLRDVFSWVSWSNFWPLILICLGISMGIRKKFRNNGWWILTLIGVAHLVPEFEVMTGVWSSELIWPTAVIIGGLLIVFRSSKKNDYMDKLQVVTSNENALNIDVTFGGRKEIVTSKDFKGGNISTTFGGCEINMTQADSTQPMILNFRVSFGGVELVVPSHWELQNEIDPTFGSVEDHRSIRTPQSMSEEKRLLILKGNCNFGSIEIKSY